MTSHFTDGYTEEEFIDKLMIFRSEYRLLEAKLEHSNREISRLNTVIEDLTTENEQLQNRYSYMTKYVKRLQTKKLSLKERITGKIKY